MRRLSFAALVFLLLTSLAVGLANAADLEMKTPEKAEAPEANQAVEAPEACGQTFDLETFLSTPINELNQIDINPLNCNCNSNADCRRICGGEGGTCFIGPVCDNWPDFTGKCMCPKPIDTLN